MIQRASPINLVAFLVITSVVTHVAYVLTHYWGFLWNSYAQQFITLIVIGLATYLTFRRDQTTASLPRRFLVSISISSVSGLIFGVLLTAYVLWINPDHRNMMAHWSALDLGPSASGSDSAGEHFGASILYTPGLSAFLMLIYYTVVGLATATSISVWSVFRKRPA